MAAVNSKAVIMILISVLCIALGQVAWKLGTNQTGAVTFSSGHLLSSMGKFVNVWFIIGCVMLLASSVLWVAALSMVQLSFAFPFQSLAYVFIFFFSLFIFKEPVTLFKALGTFLIIIGVLAVSKG